MSMTKCQPQRRFWASSLGTRVPSEQVLLNLTPTGASLTQLLGHSSSLVTAKEFHDDSSTSPGLDIFQTKWKGRRQELEYETLRQKLTSNARATKRWGLGPTLDSNPGQFPQWLVPAGRSEGTYLGCRFRPGRCVSLTLRLPSPSLPCSPKTDLW